LGITSNDTLLEDAFAAIEELITGNELPSQNKTSDVSGFDVESWSKKEGWSEEYFHKKVEPYFDEAWQVEFELMSSAD
jgi:hypothetical protein